MIVLDATTKSLEVLLDAAATTTELPVMASFVEMTTSAYTPKESDTITTGATAVTAVAAPAASTQRQVKLLTVVNVDTAVRTVTVRYNNNSTTRKLFVATLAVGDMLTYSDGEGWRCFDSTGALKMLSSRSTNDRMRSVGFTVDGGASTLSTGYKGNISIPYSGRIQKVTTLSKNGVTGSIVIDIWRDTYANFPPTVADTITASAKPTISSATKATDSTLTGWNKVVTAGDVLAINIDSVTTFTWIALIIDLLTD